MGGGPDGLQAQLLGEQGGFDPHLQTLGVGHSWAALGVQ